MQIHERIFVDNDWVVPIGAATMDVINPSSEEKIGSIPLCSSADVDDAVAAARAAFEGWSATPLQTRIGFINAIAAGLQDRSTEIAETIAAEMGMPLPLAKIIQAGLPVAVLKGFAEIAASYPFEETLGSSLIVKEPVGVCGFITPWNYPLHQIIGKVAPALATGCTMVVKPSEIAPLNAFILAEIIAEVGLPKGVFNLVTGLGPVVGEALAAHPDVDMISFTGSTRAGIRVAELAAGTVKRVTQELGGKSANLILADADFTVAVTKGVQDCYLNSGQTCSALTRMLVPADRQDEAAAIAAQAVSFYKPGDALAKGSRLGPMVSAAQRERVENYINKGLAEGARLVVGGPGMPEGLEKGYFIKPTIFADVTREMTIAREEIFGPVLSIMPYSDEEEAIAIANDSEYGLAGGVWSAEREHAIAVARRLRTGQVTINGSSYNPLAPFGGYKKSGNGREFGPYGLEEYLEIKALQLSP